MKWKKTLQFPTDCNHLIRRVDIMTSSLSVGWVSFVTGGSSKLFTLSEAVKVGERVVCRSNRCALVNCLRLFLFFLCCLLLLFCWSRHILLGFTVWRRFIFTRRLLRGSHRRTFCVRTLGRSRTGSVSLSLSSVGQRWQIELVERKSQTEESKRWKRPTVARLMPQMGSTAVAM